MYNLTTLEITLSYGNKTLINLPENIARSLVDTYAEGTEPRFKYQDKNETHVFDLNSIVHIHARGVGRPTGYEKHVTELKENYFEKAIVEKKEEPKKEDGRQKSLHHITCRCGADYYAPLYEDTLVAGCRECNEKVYVDTYADLESTKLGAMAKVVTNKYFVKKPEGK